jgi:dsRNA-specific ribonuclease
MHVTKLKEYGDAIRESPKYSHFTIASDPPTTYMTVQFGGHKLETTGRSIKEAKQQLAMLLCAELGLHIPWDL